MRETHDTFNSQDYWSAQTRVRVHMTHNRTGNTIDRRIYESATRKMQLKTPNLGAFLERADVLYHDAWLCKLKEGSDELAPREDMDLEEYCRNRGVPFSTVNWDQDLRTLLKLPVSTILFHPQVYTLRQRKILYASLVADKAASKFPADSVMSAPISNSIGRFYWRHGVCATFDSNTRCVVLVKSSSSEWQLRPVAVSECWRLMSKPIEEVLNSKQLSAVKRKLGHHKMISSGGQSFDEATMVCHWIASTTATQARLDGKPLQGSLVFASNNSK